MHHVFVISEKTILPSNTGKKKRKLATNSEEAWDAFAKACNSIQSEPSSAPKSTASAFGNFVGFSLEEMAGDRRSWAMKEILNILLSKDFPSSTIPIIQGESVIPTEASGQNIRTPASDTPSPTPSVLTRPRTVSVGRPASGTSAISMPATSPCLISPLGSKSVLLPSGVKYFY